MANTYNVTVDDPASVLLTYTEIQVYSDTSPTGGFTNLVATVALVATQFLYTVSDASGGVATLYRHRFYNPTGGASTPLSLPAWANGFTLETLRVTGAKEAGLGWDSTCTAVGTTTTLVDAVASDNGVDVHFAEGAWLYRPNAALASDKQRRVSLGGFNPSTGAFTVQRAWTNAPASGEYYQLFNLAPCVDEPGATYSFDRAARDAMANTWYTDQVMLGPGNGLGQDRFDLSPYPWLYKTQVRRVFRRTYDNNGNPWDVDHDTREMTWEIFPGGQLAQTGAWGQLPNQFVLWVYPAPYTSEFIVVEYNRPFDLPYSDTDTLTCPFRLGWTAMLMKLYETMNQIHNESYAGDLARWKAEFSNEYSKVRPHPIVRGL